MAASAGAQVRLDTFREHATTVPSGGAIDVSVLVPFHLDQDGYAFAKLLVTPWNAVNNGTANGTVDAAGAAGTSGWWVTFHLANATGQPLLLDGQNQTLDPFLGARVDSTPTPAVFLRGGTPHHLVLTVHMPAEAAWPGSDHRVVVALVFREASAAGGGTSGGMLEQSRSYTETLEVRGTAVPGGGGADGGGNGGRGGGGGDAGAGDAAPPGVLARLGITSGTTLALLAGLALSALVASAVALTAAAYALLHATRLLREARALEPGGAAREPEAAEGPGAGKETAPGK